MLQTWKLAQKILNAILRRMVYSLRGNKQYLKSQFGEIGRFSCFSGVFPNFPDFVAAKRGAGPIESPRKLQISVTRWHYYQFSNRLIQFNLN